MSVADRCVDCGIEPNEQHLVLLIESQRVNKHIIAWKRCARCWLKAGAQDAIERRETEQRAEKAVR